MSKNAVDLEKTLSALRLEEKKLIRASFQFVYSNILLFPQQHCLNVDVPPHSLGELVEDCQNTSPSNSMSFSLCANVYGKGHGEGRFVPEEADRVCSAIIGKQE